MERIAQGLKPLHNINRLTIDVRTEPRLTAYASVLKRVTEQRLCWNMRDHDAVLGVRKMSTLPEASAAIRSMWLAFNELRGTQDVALSGDIDAELAQESTAVMKTGSPELRSAQAEYQQCNPLEPKKLFRLQRQTKQRRIERW